MVSFANAKINIGLQIVGKRDDGYHLINTVFYPVRQLTDIVEVIKSNYEDLVQTGYFLNIPKEQNLAYKAYKILADDFNLPPVMIYLHKMIPFGAGLGGGSSDAATVLKLTSELFGLDLPVQKLKEYAARLGADCVFFIENKPSYATGIGDKMEPVKLNLELYNIVIVKPDFSISTKEAYSLVRPSEPQFDLRQIGSLPIEQWKDYVVNDFEKFLFDKYPQLAKIKQELYDLGALYASLSGSGSAVFGIFDYFVDTEKLKYPFVWQSYF